MGLDATAHLYILLLPPCKIAVLIFTLPPDTSILDTFVFMLIVLGVGTKRILSPKSNDYKKTFYLPEGSSKKPVILHFFTQKTQFTCQDDEGGIYQDDDLLILLWLFDVEGTLTYLTSPVS